VYANVFNTVVINPLTTTTTSASVAPDNNAFAFTVGFGLDIHINRRWSLRPAEVGYLLTEFGNPFTGRQTQNTFRYAAGLTFNFH
jgi:hypothetical protein